MIRNSLLLALAALGGLAAGGPAEARTLQVVASFTVLADVVGEVGGSHVNVVSLVGPDGDPHEFEPSPNDAKVLKGADIVFASGLGFEGWMNRLVSASGTAAAPVEASVTVATRQMEEDGETVTDPHVWNDPKNVAQWVSVIEAALVKADPADAGDFRANAARYRAELAGLDAYARRALAGTPPEARRILTSHDAFGYFGAAYGVEFLAPLGVSTESEASAMDVAALIEQIRAERIGVYFIENSNDPRLVQQIADATGARPGGALYVESLSGPDGPAPTYARMFRYNVDQIVAALARTN